MVEARAAPYQVEYRAGRNTGVAGTLKDGARPAAVPLAPGMIWL
jgi:hypothetical protein